MQPEEARAFNAHVASATGLAVYGCGILAAAHVGGLRALERHGLRYDRITTLAGVSAGSVVVAMLSLGCDAAELYALIASLPFDQLGRPELGALLRAGTNPNPNPNPSPSCGPSPSPTPSPSRNANPGPHPNPNPSPSPNQAA